MEVPLGRLKMGSFCDCNKSSRPFWMERMVSSPEAASSFDLTAWLFVVRLAWSVLLLPIDCRRVGACGSGCVCDDGMRLSPGIPKLVRSIAGAPVSDEDDENSKLLGPEPLDPPPPPNRKEGSRRMVVAKGGADEEVVVVDKVLAPNVVGAATAADPDAGVVVCCNCCRGMDGICEFDAR